MSKVTKSNNAELMAKWQQLKPQVTKNLFNKIVVDNKRILVVDDKEEINPDFGKLFAIQYDGENENKKEIDIKTARFFLIKARVHPQGSYDEDTGKAKFYCVEADEREYITVIDAETKEQVANDEWKKVKDQYGLRFRSAIYVEYEGSIYRWILTGAHFDTWFDVKNQLEKKEMPHTFKISSIEKKTVGSVVFNTINFAIAEEYDVETAVSNIETLNNSLKEYYNSKKEISQLPSPDDLPEIPEIKHESKTNIQDVPF